MANQQDTHTVRKHDNGVAIPHPVQKNMDSFEESSGAAATPKPDWQGPAPAAGHTPTPFGGNELAQQLNNMNMNGNAASFEPATSEERGYLLANSQPLMANATGAHKNKDKAPSPIGTRDTGFTPIFTSDWRPAAPLRGGHYICIEVVASKLPQVLADLNKMYNWDTKILGQKSLPIGDEHKTVAVYLCFDDVDCAAKAEDQVGVVAQNWDWHVSYITQQQYASANSSEFNGTKEATSVFDGQVLFEVVWTGHPKRPDLVGVDYSIHEVAQTFGEVIALSDGSPTSGTRLEFRVEFKKITAAHDCLAQISDMNPYHFGDWSAISKKLPEPGQHKPAKRTAFGQTMHTPSKVFEGGSTVTVMSPSGRTAWTIDEEGNRIAQPPAKVVPKVLPHGASNEDAGSRPQHPGASESFTPTPVFFNGSQGFGTPHHASGAHSQAVVAYNGPKEGENEPQTISVENIINGRDVRTTVMLRNIPNRWNYLDIKRILDTVTAAKYDFSYLRIDFEKSSNVGYAFVNFIDAEYIVPFLQHFVGHEWLPGHMPHKVAQVSYATIQGIDCLVEKFRNSAIMDEMPDYRPKLWYVAADAPRPELVGTDKPFPPPNNLSKKQRSNDNAGTVGLYAPHRGQRGDNRARRSNYDRGTPHQMQEEAMYAKSPTYAFDNHFVSRGNPGNPAPIGPPPPFPQAMSYPAFHPMPFGYQYVGPYGMPMNYGPPMYNPHAHSGYNMPPPAFAPLANGSIHGTPASRLRTISRGRLHSRPQNVTVSARGYSDVEQGPSAGPSNYATGHHVPRTFSNEGATYQNGEYHQRK